MESGGDTVADRMVHVAEGGPVSSRNTVRAEVQAGSALRLPWLWAEGWRARLRKAGDQVEKARWEWRMDDLLGGKTANVPDIVARVPGSIKGAHRRRPGKEDVHSQGNVRFQHGSNG